jgi:hypothetical protein
MKPHLNVRLIITALIGRVGRSLFDGGEYDEGRGTLNGGESGVGG